MNEPLPTFTDDPSLEKVNMAFYRRSFVTGEANTDRMRIQYFLRRADGHMFADCWFGPEAEGPPGFAHGGSQAAILDEAMGVMAWFNRYPVVTVNLSVNYKDLMPLDQHAVLETWIEKTEGRKVFTYGEIRTAEDKVVSTATGIFVTLPPEKFGDNWPHIARHYKLDDISRT